MITRTRQCRHFSIIQIHRKLFTSTQFRNNSEVSTVAEAESAMVTELTIILREKPQNSWKDAISKSSINLKLKLQPHHVEKCKLFWPASSLVQTLIHNHQNYPHQVFHDFFVAFRDNGFSSLLGFDLLIQNYVQCRRAMDGVVFLKLMLENGIVPEVRTLSALFHALIGIRKFRLVLEMFHQVFNGFRAIRPDVYVYTAVVRCLAVEMVREMVELGFSPSEGVVSTLVDGLRKKGKVMDAFDLVNELLWPVILPNVVVYTALINSLLKDGKLQQAESLFKRMDQRGLLPNEVTFLAMIDSFCKQGRLGDALNLLARMSEARVKVTNYVYNSLIHGHCKFGKMNTAEYLFKEMISKEHTPTVVTYTSLISGYCGEGEINKAFRLYHEMMGKGIAPNTYTYTALIHGLCRAKRMVDANNLFKEMTGRSVLPNEVTYNVMIDGYCMEGDISKGFQLLDEMLEGGLVPDTYTYRSLISGLCSAGRVFDAKKLVDGLYKEDFELNEMCSSALLKGYCKEGRVQDALCVYGEMLERKIKMDLVCYAVLIDATLKQNDKERLLLVLKEMHVKGMKPDNVIYTSMVNAYTKAGNVKKAFQLWDIMISEGCEPNVVTYTVLIDGLCRSGSVNKAHFIYNKMLSNDTNPNQITYGCFLSYYTNIGNMENAVQLHKLMLKGSGNMLEALRIWDSMLSDNIRPDAVAYNFLISGCHLSGDVKKAALLRDDMIAKGFKSDAKSMEVPDQTLGQLAQAPTGARLVGLLTFLNLLICLKSLDCTIWLQTGLVRLAVGIATLVVVAINVITLGGGNTSLNWSKSPGSSLAVKDTLFFILSPFDHWDIKMNFSRKLQLLPYIYPVQFHPRITRGLGIKFFPYSRHLNPALAKGPPTTNNFIERLG
ncbi:hypothetical protein RDABS01_033609 [Bienertia sinuspersici]